MVRAEFIGKDVARRNQGKLLDSIRTLYPNVSESGIQAMAQHELARVSPRYQGFVHNFWGADLLTDDPASSVEVWHLLTPLMRQDALAKDLDPSRLLDPEGLSKTYVWRFENDWLQDVTDDDWAVIQASVARRWFRDIDVFGRYRPVRSFDLPVLDSMSFDDAVEAKRYEREELSRKKLWTPGQPVNTR